MGTIIDQGFLELLKTMTLNIQLSLKSGNLGNKRSKSTGSSVEFSDYRDYMPGDDFRRIDWNAYGRFEKVFIKLFMQEQEAPITVFIDKSASMGTIEKMEAAIKIAATFCYIALTDYDTISITEFNHELQKNLTQLRGKASFNQVIKFLEQMEFEGNSSLYEAVKKWEPRFKKGMTILISDLMYDHQFEKVIRLLSFKKQRVILCHVLNEEELNPVFNENVRIIDLETNEGLDIDTGVEAINLYKQALAQYMIDIRSLCKKYQVDYVFVEANKSIEHFMKQIHGINTR